MKHNENPDVIQLDLPLREGTPGYVGLFLRYYSMLASIISDAKGKTDYRIVLMTNLIIATIPDDDIRDKLKELYKALMVDKTNEYEMEHGEKPGTEERVGIMIDCSMDILGEVSGFMDMYMGVSKKLSVIIENPINVEDAEMFDKKPIKDKT